jgi:hypothetical protein
LNYRRFDLSAGDAPLKKTAIYNKATAHPAQAILTANEHLESFEKISTMVADGKSNELSDNRMHFDIPTNPFFKKVRAFPARVARYCQRCHQLHKKCLPST